MKSIQKKNSDIIFIEDFQEIIKFYKDNLMIYNDINRNFFDRKSTESLNIIFFF